MNDHETDYLIGMDDDDLTDAAAKNAEEVDPEVIEEARRRLIYQEDDLEDFEPIDVSEPRAPRKEIEVIEEALAIRRRDWLKGHISYVYAAAGIVVVIVIIAFIYMFYRNSNPLSRMMTAASKDFGTSFDFTAEMTENGEPVMQYEGTASFDRSRHTIEAVCSADYNTYTYTTVVTADRKKSTKGIYYSDKWTLRDCSDAVQNFIDFDRSFSKGEFNGGAFLRFTELTSDYSTREIDSFMKIVKNRLTTNSTITSVTSEKVGGDTHYHYDIDLYELMDMISKEGASIFYRASDYEKFVAAFEDNKSVIKNAKFSFDYVVNSSGYLSSFETRLISNGRNFGFSCEMSNFGKAGVEIPEGYQKALERAAVE